MVATNKWGIILNKATEKNIVKRQILWDNPAEADAFSGGGHERTAKALARTIRDFDKSDRSIGLEGRWGSGKSSIVKMSTKELNAEKTGIKFHVFEFDLWANQTTHFRRAFLESLLKWAATKFPTKNSSS